MRIQAYLRVLSDEATVKAIHEETRVADAQIKELKSQKDSSGKKSWNWETARVSIDVDGVDEGINSLLSQYSPIFLKIGEHQGPHTDTYLEIVSNYEKNEEPRGLYLSAATIKLLSELGCALDNDVYGFENS